MEADSIEYRVIARAYVEKLDPRGAHLYSTCLGSADYVLGNNVATDPAGNAYLIGYASDHGLPVTGALQPEPGGGGWDAFIAKLGPTGEKIDFATLFGRPWTLDTEFGGEPVAAGPRGETYLADNTPVVRFAANRPPDCAAAVVSPAMIWPPDGRMAPVTITGVTDPEGGEIELSVTAIFQDEPSTLGTADATGLGTPNVSLRAARSGGGDGRVYRLRFTAADESGLACTGEVTVCVPHSQGRGRTCGDGGALFASGPGGAGR